MVNENSIQIPDGVDLSKLNIAFELMWLNILYKEGYIDDEQYNKVKLLINKKYL